MKRVFVLCSQLKPDLMPIVDSQDLAGDVIWMEAGLHARPDHLRQELQATVDSIAGCEEIRLGYALCGNALLGLVARTADVCYIRADDCIHAFMCENPRLKELRSTSIFTNRSWLSTSSGDANDTERIMAKYGEKRGKRIIQAMYGHYANTVYMKTEDSPTAEDLARAQAMATRIATKLVLEDASLSVYEALLNCQDHPMIRTLKMGESLGFSDFSNF